jgi:hypothetical protein
VELVKTLPVYRELSGWTGCENSSWWGCFALLSERRNVGNNHNFLKSEFALVSFYSLQSRFAFSRAALPARLRCEQSKILISPNYWFLAFSANLVHAASEAKRHAGIKTKNPRSACEPNGGKRYCLFPDGHGCLTSVTQTVKQNLAFEASNFSCTTGASLFC